MLKALQQRLLTPSDIPLTSDHRPDWKKFMRGPKESAKGYKARLQQAFSFTQSEVLLGEGTASKGPAKQPSKQEGKSSKVRSSA